MFSIIISEKGGAERRETYDKTEINVGRVQGNDLMLPKGNVSKRHARLLFRDGRFIVTDLKSTNGTYVNGRKIAQATIVREGDKIYIGDFVLRIEGAGAASGAPAAASSPPGEDIAPASPASNLSHGGEPRIDSKPAPSPPDAVSHFPLEHDPDDSNPSYAVPGPPPIPGTAPPRPSSSGHRPPPPHVPNVTSPAPPPVVPRADGASAPPASPSRSPIPAPAPSAIPIPSSNRRSEDRVRPESREVQAGREALNRLIAKVEEKHDLGRLDREDPPEDLLRSLESAIGEAANAMKSAGEIPGGLTPEALGAHAKRELFDLGPIGELLVDEDVLEIQVIGHDYVVALGDKGATAALPFTSERAVHRMLARLARQAELPISDNETYVERRLPRGVRLFAVRPPAAQGGHMVVLRKPQHATAVLDDLVRSGTISRGMATLFAHCVQARANILVTGALGAGASTLLGGLASAGSTDDRVVVLQEDDELILNQPHTISLLMGDTEAEGAKAVRAAVRVRPDRLIVGSFAGHVAVEVVDAIGDGVHGVLAAARAPTLRQLAARAPADLAATRRGITVEAAREWFASSFDLCIEIARLKDGRHRVLRVAELTPEANGVALRDIFSFSVERTATGGMIEGSFHATGTVPRIVDDFAARGIAIEPSIFKRAK